MRIRLFLLAALLPLQAIGQTIIHDELDEGDFDNTGNATEVSFILGVNRIIGSVVASSDTRDFFTFSILDGQQLTRIDIIDYNDPAIQGANDGNTGFFHVASGKTSQNPATSQVGILGGAHLEPVAPGTNYLDVLAPGASTLLVGPGISGPLGPGDYTVNIQQTGPQVSNYIVDFTVVPEPSVAGLLNLAFLGVLRRRR